MINILASNFSVQWDFCCESKNVWSRVWKKLIFIKRHLCVVFRWRYCRPAKLLYTPLTPQTHLNVMFCSDQHFTFWTLLCLAIYLAVCNSTKTNRLVQIILSRPVTSCKYTQPAQHGFISVWQVSVSSQSLWRWSMFVVIFTSSPSLNEADTTPLSMLISF